MEIKSSPVPGKPIQATVYYGGRRRWFSQKSAARAEAKEMLRRRCKRDGLCDRAEIDHGEWMTFPCEYHGEKHAQYVTRISRMLCHRWKSTQQP